MLRSTEITVDNYTEAVEAMRLTAKGLEDKYESMVIRKTASIIEKFIEQPAKEKELESLRFLNQELDTKKVIVYTDSNEGPPEYEYMLVTKNGECYERNELNARDSFPLLTEEEIYSRAEEVRSKRDEHTESGDYWESIKEEEDYDIW